MGRHRASLKMWKSLVVIERAQQLFERAVAMGLALRQPEEIMLFSFAGEASDFVRLNRNEIRQAGHVLQYDLTVSLINGRRNAEATLSLSGMPALDHERLQRVVAELRVVLQAVNDDPHLCYAESNIQNTERRPYAIPVIDEILGVLHASAAGLDLVGLWASGEQYRGFASSFGQRQWHSAGSFNLDASVHLPNGSGVKLSHAGQRWDQKELQQTVAKVQEWSQFLQRTPRPLIPGDYRVYLAPTALADIVQILAYGGFSRRAVAAHRSPLMRLQKHERQLNERLTLTEARDEGLEPAFSPKGFALPTRVPLIVHGRAAELLSDARSSAEFDVLTNCASEMPQSLSLSPGSLPPDDVLQQLGDGLYLNNLWYGNLSDQDACRITGSTRFACFWVEGGRITAPLTTSRFDDSVYRLLGPELEDLTRGTTCILNPGTYEARSSASLRLPGALVKRMRFVM